MHPIKITSGTNFLGDSSLLSVKPLLSVSIGEVLSMQRQDVAYKRMGILFDLFFKVYACWLATLGFPAAKNHLW